MKGSARAESRKSEQRTGIGVRDLLVVAGLYALLTGVLHAEVVYHIGTRALGWETPDTHLHFWDFWWAWKSLVELHVPFTYSEYVGYPPGVSTWRVNSGPLLAYFSVPLRLLTGNPVATYNLTTLLSLWMSCLGGYWLVRSLRGSPLGAFCAGAVLAFNPLVSLHANLGFLEYLNLGPGALFVGYTVRMITRGDHRSVLASLMSFVVAITWCWYMGLLLLLFAALLFLFHWRAVLGRLRSPRTAVGLALWGSCVGILLAFVGDKVQDPELTARKTELEREFMEDRERIESVTVFWGRPVLTHVKYRDCDEDCPSEFPLPWLGLKLGFSLDPSYLIGGGRETGHESTRYVTRTFSRTLNVVYWLPLLVLATAGLLRVVRRRGHFRVEIGKGEAVFLAAIAVFGGLSLGPCLNLGHEVLLATCGYTPLSVLAKVMLAFARVQFPIRFLFGSLYALVILAGLGFGRLVARRRHGTRAPELACVAVVASITLCHSIVNDYQTRCSRIEVPEFYRLAGEDRDSYAVIEVPLASTEHIDKMLDYQLFDYYQTIHDKRRLRGPIPACLQKYGYPADIDENHLLDLVAHLSANEEVAEEEIDDARLQQSVEVLRRHGFRYVILHLNHRSFSVDTSSQLRALLQRALGPGELDLTTGDHLAIYSIGGPGS